MGARQILERVRAVLASPSAGEIKQALRGFVEDSDRILVVEVGRGWSVGAPYSRYES